MKLTWRLKEALGLRDPGYPCRCGGNRSGVEFHTTQGCTDSAWEFASLWDTQFEPVPPEERWTKDELPLDSS